MPQVILNYSEVLDRMLEAGKLANSSQLARLLGITPQALSNYKKRGDIPTSLLFKFAAIYDISVDWLISGVGSAFKCLEDTAPYDAGCGHSMEFAGFSPEEIIYIGKILKILRSSNPHLASALKSSIDAFLSAVKQECD